MSSKNYVLNSDICNSCVWCEDGFYNRICAHCPRCHYSKDTKDFFMDRKTAEMLGIGKKKEVRE